MVSLGVLVLPNLEVVSLGKRTVDYAQIQLK